MSNLSNSSKASRPPKPSEPIEPGPQSPRPPGTLRVKAHYRHDRLKGWLPIRGHWRKGERQKPANPVDRVLRVIEEAEQNERDGLRLIEEMDRALSALRAWDPEYCESWEPPVPGDAQSAQPLLEHEATKASEVVMRELLSHLTKSVSDEMLAAVGLQRCERPDARRMN